MEDKHIRQDLYQRTRDDLLKRQLSNSEHFDKAILTLSSAGLGLSLTFIKNVVQIDVAEYQWMLILSWILFTLSIVVTLVSFHISQAGISTQLDIAEDYYINGNEDALQRDNNPAIWTERAGYISAATFVIAIIFLVLFISLNIGAGEKPMTDEQQNEGSEVQSLEGGAIVPQLQKVETQKGATIPPIQAVNNTGDRGATIPSVQRVPDAQPSSQPVVNDDTGSQPNAPQPETSGDSAEK